MDSKTIGEGHSEGSVKSLARPRDVVQVGGSGGLTAPMGRYCCSLVSVDRDGGQSTYSSIIVGGTNEGSILTKRLEASQN